MNKKVWDEILTRATTGMNLEDMMLSEISQPHKEKYLHEIPRVVKLIDRRQDAGSQGPGALGRSE